MPVHSALNLMSMPSLFVLAALVALGACHGETLTPPASDAGAPFRIALGGTATVAGTAVRFESVVSDSRCPEGVQCVWEGAASVRLVVGGEPLLLSIPRSGPPGEGEPPVGASAGGLHLEALALTPTPGSAEAQAGAAPSVELAATPAGR